MNLSRPWAVIRSPIDLEIVRVLQGTTRPLTGREVARLSRSGSQSAVNAGLRRLVEEGLLLSEEAGRAFLYRLNRDHLAAPPLQMLADLRHELQRRIAEEVSGWKPRPEHLSIFGSAARGDGDTRSDIDIFVVRPPRLVSNDSTWRGQLDRLSKRVQAWTGNQAAISEVSKSDILRLRRERPAIIGELRRDAITLAGPSPAQLFGGAK